MKRLTPPLVLATTFVLAVAALSSANHTLDTLRVGYHETLTQLRWEREAALKQARADYHVTLKQLKYAERDARRLCEPERSCVLAKIRADRRVAANGHRQVMVGIRRSYDLAIRRAKANYLVACREVRVVVETLPCGCPVDACTCQPLPPVEPAPCNECNLPFPHSPAIHKVTRWVPEVYRVQTTRPVVVRPTLGICPPPASTMTFAVEPEPPCYDDRPVISHRRPVSHLLRALLASL
jgi:hypothetical protein